MSRIGNKSIILEPDIKASIQDNLVQISGPLGTISVKLPSDLKVEINGSEIHLTVKDGSGKANVQGLFRTLIQNAVIGVKKQWTKILELVGVGYRAEVRGNDLVLNVGFTHQVIINAKPGISFKVEENKITVIGSDKYMVGEVAASIRRIKPPEPYKGKGIKYQGELIRKKLGKAAKTVGGAGGAK